MNHKQEKAMFAKKRNSMIYWKDVKNQPVIDRGSHWETSDGRTIYFTGDDAMKGVKNVLAEKAMTLKLSGGFIPLGKITTCKQCSFHGYGKQGQYRGKDFVKSDKSFCNNCGLNKPPYLLR